MWAAPLDSIADWRIILGELRLALVGIFDYTVSPTLFLDQLYVFVGHLYC